MISALLGAWAGVSRTGVETGVQSTGALERCGGAEHYWGSRHCGGAGDAEVSYRTSAEQTGRHTGALEHRVANRPELEVVDALMRLSAGRREEPNVTEVATDDLQLGGSDFRILWVGGAG